VSFRSCRALSAAAGGQPDTGSRPWFCRYYELKLYAYGMRAAFDEVITTAVKRQHEPQRVVGDLLSAEISEKQAHSIKYQITIAKLPLAKLAPARAGGRRRLPLRRHADQ
jgi:hypothetical protein